MYWDYVQKTGPILSELGFLFIPICLKIFFNEGKYKNTVWQFSFKECFNSFQKLFNRFFFLKAGEQRDSRVSRFFFFFNFHLPQFTVNIRKGRNKNANNYFHNEISSLFVFSFPLQKGKTSRKYNEFYLLLYQLKERHFYDAGGGCVRIIC